MTADALRCKCGGEVRVVRLNARTLALGHVQNPKNAMHAVRLARAADGRSATSPRRREDTHRQPEAPERGAPARMPNGTRPAANGPTRTSPALGAPSSGS